MINPKLKKYRKIEDAYVEDNVEFVANKCKCGHTLTFLTRHPRTCTYCGRLVYANQEDEFKEKLKIMLRRNNNE